jgi:hypothetical protein
LRTQFTFSSGRNPSAPAPIRLTKNTTCVDDHLGRFELLCAVFVRVQDSKWLVCSIVIRWIEGLRRVWPTN